MRFGRAGVRLEGVLGGRLEGWGWGFTPSHLSFQEHIAKYTTMMYRPPEMVDFYQQFVISEKVDVWMLGCILFTLMFCFSSKTRTCFECCPSCCTLGFVNASGSRPNSFATQSPGRKSHSNLVLARAAS